jgi:hypothetical protein
VTESTKYPGKHYLHVVRSEFGILQKISDDFLHLPKLSKIEPN